MADPKVILQGEQTDTDDAPEEIIVLEGDEPSKQPAGDPEPDGDDDGEEDEQSDLRVSHEQRDDENTADRRKRERHQRKERQRIARERKDHEIELLKQQNEHMRREIDRISQGQASQHIANVEQRIGWAKQHVEAAEAQIADATNRGDGAALAKALSYRDDAKAAANQLERERAARTAQSQQGGTAPRQATTPAAATPDPQVAQHAKAWIEANPWFDYNADTPEVRRTKKVEADLMREGMRPNDRGFWTELTKRIQGNDDMSAEPAKPRGGPKVGGNTEAAGKRSVEFRVSADRVAAMKDAGIWDDPERRAKQIKSYMEYDKAHPTPR